MAGAKLISIDLGEDTHTAFEFCCVAEFLGNSRKLCIVLVELFQIVAPS